MNEATSKVIEVTYGLIRKACKALRTGKLKDKEKFLKILIETVPYLNEKNEAEKLASKTLEEKLGEMREKGILETGI